MSTSVWRPIRAELRRILLTVPGVPDIHFEMQGFKPTVGVAWIYEAIEKGPETIGSLGPYGTRQENGIYLVDLHWPSSGVKADGEDLADAIRLAFWPGRAIAPAGPDFLAGEVIRSNPRRTVPGDTWTTFPVRVEFFVRRATNQGRA